MSSHAPRGVGEEHDSRGLGTGNNPHAVHNVHALLSVTGSSHPTRLRRALSVRRRVQRAGGGKVEIRPPKYGSERTVYLPDELLQLLSEHAKCVRTAEPRWLFV